MAGTVMLLTCWIPSLRTSYVSIEEPAMSLRLKHIHHTATGLDPPVWLYFPRLLRRTIGRWLGFIENCSPGCGESFHSIFLSSKSILWYAASQHAPTRREFSEAMRLEMRDNCGETKYQRFGGWGDELATWISLLRRRRSSAH